MPQPAATPRPNTPRQPEQARATLAPSCNRCWSTAPIPHKVEAQRLSTMTASSSGNAAALYELIRADGELTQSLFRQALQDPSGALARIVALGDDHDLPVSADEVRSHIASLDDAASKQWLLKARGGL